MGHRKSRITHHTSRIVSQAIGAWHKVQGMDIKDGTKGLMDRGSEIRHAHAVHDIVVSSK